MTVFLAIKNHTIGSVFIKFTSKHFEIEEILIFVIKFFNFSAKGFFFRLGFLDFPLLNVLDFKYYDIKDRTNVHSSAGSAIVSCQWIRSLAFTLVAFILRERLKYLATWPCF